MSEIWGGGGGGGLLGKTGIEEMPRHSSLLRVRTIKKEIESVKKDKNRTKNSVGLGYKIRSGGFSQKRGNPIPI